MIYTNLNTFQNAVNTAKPGDIVELKPGTYDGDVQLNYRGSEDVKVIMNGVTLNYKNGGGHYTLDLIGEHIHVEADELKLNGGKIGVLGIRGHNLTLISDLKGYITGDNLGGDLFGTNNHLQGLNFDGLGNVGMSAKGFPLDEDRNHPYPYPNGVFGWYPSNNWRITQCVFQNIAPHEPGDAGGGFRIIPHAKDVMVDNCIFRNITGSGLWGDHNQKGFEFYYNLFEDIKTAEVSGKALFLEIMDPDPNDTSGFVAKIAGNTFRRCDTQTILIAASSGQNPGGIDVFGNIIEDGWGIVAGAMQRTFQRRWTGKTNKGGWEAVEAKLENIRIRKNVIKQTTGRNHLSLFQGRNSGLIEVDNNFYATGHSYKWKKPNGIIEEGQVLAPQIYKSAPDSEGLFIHGKSNAADIDQNAVYGSFPDDFPFPEVWEEIPVEKVDISGGTVDVPIDDPIDDPVIDPPSNGLQLPKIWLFSDDADRDDQVVRSVLLFLGPGNYKIEGITVGCQPTDAGYIPKDYFANRHFLAFQKEGANLGYDYDLFFNQAKSYRKKFDVNNPLETNYINLDNYTKENPLILCNGSPLTEIAYLVKNWIDQGADLDKIIIHSHFTAKESDNNYKKDKEAAKYLKNLAKQGIIKFIEFDESGARVIGRKDSYSFSNKVYQSDIGKFIKDKDWDFSDFATVIPFVLDEFSGYLDEAKTDGTSNLNLFMTYWENDSKDRLYEMIEQAAVKAVQGSDDPVIDDPIIDNPTNKELIESKLNQIDTITQEIRELL